MDVPGKPFKPSLIFESTVRNYPSRTPYVMNSSWILYRKVAYFELSSHQISEPNNRLSVRTSISQMSQRGSLINQRDRRISLFPDVFSYVSLPTLSTDADRRYPGFNQHSHSHALSLSVSPLPSLTFFCL